MVSDLINTQVMNFKKYLEKEQKNLLLVKTGKNGEIIMPSIEELLRFDTSGITKGEATRGTGTTNNKASFMDTRVI